MDKSVKINKYIASCGIASRRGAEELIEAGKITINGIKATLADRVVPGNDLVLYQGKPIKPIVKTVYYILNKPAEVLSSVTDDRGRRCVTYFMPKIIPVFPIGRLDYDVIGAILLTNDGDLAYRLTHPKFGVEKVYIAEVLGSFEEESATKLMKGIKIEDVLCTAKHVKVMEKSPNANITKVRIIMTEGKKREVKELFKAVGHRVMKLKRIAFAGISIKDLKIGEYRELTKEEVESLKLY